MNHHLRIARPVTDLARSTALYRDGLGLAVLASFRDHDGFDGVVLGVPGEQHHLELTFRRSNPLRPQPTPDDLIVFYVPDAAEWRGACARALAAGFAPVTSVNPYWDARGRTFADPDGYRVVLQNARWTGSDAAPSAADIRAGYVPGCIGRVAALHADYYAAAAGFGVAFESKVARELGEFCERYDAGRDGLWLVVRSGAIEGSIAIDGLQAAADGAHLRWFIVSDALRGTGLGNALLERATGFCRERGYARIFLWTFEGLDAAAHLYRKHGFRLAAEQRGSRWGREVVEQRYELGPEPGPAGT